MRVGVYVCVCEDWGWERENMASLMCLSKALKGSHSKPLFNLTP